MSKFKIGDRVRCVYSHGVCGITEGLVYSVSDTQYENFIKIQDDPTNLLWADWRFVPAKEEEGIAKQELDSDVINSPKHYMLTENFEVRDLMKLILERIEESDKMSMSHFQASCFKECLQYLIRAALKNGWEDIRKAKYYLDVVLDEEERKND